MDNNIFEKIEKIDCSNSYKYVNWLFLQYKKEAYDIDKIKPYLIDYYYLLDGDNDYSTVDLKDIDYLINKVEDIRNQKDDFEIILDNDDYIIIKPNSYEKIIALSEKTSFAYSRIPSECTYYYCRIKNKDIVNRLNCNYFIAMFDYNKKFLTQVRFPQRNINKDDISYLLKYFIPDDIDERKNNLTLKNLKLLEQDIVNQDIYLHNYDYSNVEVNCKKINGNVKLVSNFKTIPKFLRNIEITGNFICSNNLLENLINCPQIVNSIYCSENNLISLKGSPSYLKGDFICAHNKLKSLSHSPRIVEGKFNISHNNINSLIGSPIQVGGFIFNYNLVESFIGISQIINGNITCSYNKLKKLTGLPNRINGDLLLGYNKIRTAKNPPKIIKGYFSCSFGHIMPDGYWPEYDNNGNLIN